jgi:hypothetical protein
MNNEEDIDNEPAGSFDLASDRPTPSPVRRLTPAEEEEQWVEELRAKLAVCGEESAVFLATEGKRLGPRHPRTLAARALLRAARQIGVAPPRPTRRSRRKPAE